MLTEREMKDERAKEEGYIDYVHFLEDSATFWFRMTLSCVAVLVFAALGLITIKPW